MHFYYPDNSRNTWKRDLEKEMWTAGWTAG